MKKALALIFAILFGTVVGDTFTVKQPRFVITDSKGVLIEGISESTSEISAMAKASELPKNIKYLIARKSPLEVTFKSGVPNIPPVAVAGDDFSCESGEICFLPPCDESYDLDGYIVDCVWEQIGGPPVDIKYITPEIPNNDPEV